ncbi:MAG: nucleotidyltransferase family protein [Bacteroidales bacterium]|nr:nucleotidyltransferase family protein [Bacteroidales bacterium]
MKSLKEIQKILSSQKNNLSNRYSIKSLAIFGSYARKEQTEQSDLDILVEFNEKIGIRFIDLADELESITGVKIDLVSKKGIKDKYLNSITTDLIYV